MLKLWLDDEVSQPVRNAEYASLGVGGYLAYKKGGIYNREDRYGVKPFLSFIVGKYWMPFENLPLGGDVFLEVSRYFIGYRPGSSASTTLNIGLNLFYAAPRR